MEQALLPEHDPEESSQLQRWSPPIIDTLDFGDDYDFEASPIYPSWFHDCGSAQEPEESSGSIQAVAGQPFEVPGPETIDTSLSVARVSAVAMKQNESSITSQGNIGPSQVYTSRAQTDQGLVRIAPKPALSKRGRSPSPNLAFPLPIAGCFVFALEHPIGANPSSSKKLKRGTYAKNTCLRCQTQGKKCSGGFPCERCLELWSRRSDQANALAWRACFDSNIHELVFLAKRSEMFPRSSTDVQARSPKRPWWAKRMRLLPVAGVPETFQEFRPFLDSILQMHKTPTPQILGDRMGSENYQQKERGLVNDDMRLLRSWPSSTVSSQPAFITRDLFILVFHFKESRISEPPNQPAEEGLQVMHSLILESITCVSKLLIKLKKRAITSSERGLLLDCLWAIKQVTEYSSTSVSFDTGNTDFRSGKFLANPGTVGQTYRWEYCPKRERHLLMYCEYWLKKLADEQWREEQSRGKSHSILTYISCPAAYEPVAYAIYISRSKLADRSII